MTISYKRIVLILLSVLFQLAFVVFVFFMFPDITRYAVIFLRSIGVLITLLIIRTNVSPDYKLTWTFVILMTPLLGVVVYLISKRTITSRYIDNINANNKAIDELLDDSKLIDNYSKKIRKQACYLKKYAKASIFKGNDTKYYPLGEEMWQDMLVELEKAKKFIFLEYFIVEKGIMLDSIVKILRRKASEGVEVRFMFDSFGSIVKAPKNFAKKLRSYGIKCWPFNSKLRLFDTGFNNRDHRKMMIIDGKVAFTGGINLADEYINLVEIFGHWKDTGIKVSGSAVNYFTIMFLALWGFSDDRIPDYSDYLVDDYGAYDVDGFVAPYTDYPHDDEQVGEFMYNSMVKKASEYVYITTPYLILDYTMLNQFVEAAKEGVDIRLIMPGIPDKKIVYMLSKSFYRPLLKAGVRIFEYTPGFVHSKQFVSDDETAIIGTINLDYRSLTHHIENALWLFNDKSVMAIKEDFLKTQEKCREVTIDSIGGSKIGEVFLLPVLRAFAPLF